MTSARLEALWYEFNSRLAQPVPKPRLRVRPLLVTKGRLGECGVGFVTLDPLARPKHAFHEFAHWYWQRQDMQHRVLGARFLEAVRMGEWDSRAQETFADCLAFLMCGLWCHSGLRSVKGAEVLKALLKEQTQ